jgi:hypothetical protein
VLGYSTRSGAGLHEICTARLRRAEREARAGDVVLLSGWARSGSAASEAEQMAHAWNNADQRIVLDGRARTTVGNVIGAAALVRTLNPHEIVLVTSSWHSLRAAALLRWALRRSGATIRLAPADEPGSVAARLRELACWTLVPFGLLAVRQASTRRAVPSRESPAAVR